MVTVKVTGIDGLTANAGRFGWLLSEDGTRGHDKPVMFGAPYFYEGSVHRGWRMPWSNGVSEGHAWIDEGVTIEYLEDGE